MNPDDLHVSPNPAQAPGSPEMRAHLDKLKQERAQYIEMFAGAFLMETGSEEASKYKLVETVIREGDTMTTSWEFVLR